MLQRRIAVPGMLQVQSSEFSVKKIAALAETAARLASACKRARERDARSPGLKG